MGCGGSGSEPALRDGDGDGDEHFSEPTEWTGKHALVGGNDSDSIRHHAAVFGAVVPPVLQAVRQCGIEAVRQ